MYLLTKTQNVMSALLRNEKEYKEALDRVDKLKKKKVKKGTEKGNELDLLSLLIKHYESNIYGNLKPITAIKLRAKQLGLTDAQLTKVFGYRSRKSEIFSGSRKLSLEMIRRIHKKLEIPAEVLIKSY